MQPQKTTTRPEILVAGANGALGQKLIKLLGPRRAVAGTRHVNWDAGSFEHVSLANDEAIRKIDWHRFRAVINVAGRVRGKMPELSDANIVFPVKLALAARAGNVSKFVQVSSFSVYGLADIIDSNTPENTINDYGYTKAEGDRQLAAAATNCFQVASVRFPFLFDQQNPALFVPLFRLIKILPVLPVLSAPAKRSMITYNDAARTLIAVAENSSSGILHSADPQLFDFSLLTKLLRDEAQFALRTVRLPNVIVGVTKLAAPAIYRRIFQSSVLSPNLNVNADIADVEGIESSLRHVIRDCFC